MNYRSSLLLLLCFILIGCSSDPLDVDVSDIAVSIEFDRFENDMFTTKNVAEMDQVNKDLIERGGELYEFYVYDMLRSGSVYQDSIGTYLWYFVNDSIMKCVYEDIKTNFSDFDAIEDSIIDVFKHLKYHLPEARIPKKVITYNSAYSFGITSTDSVIGIGLDMYLGPENRIVQEVPYPLYMKEKMQKDYLPVDIAHSWLITNVLGDGRGESFLSNMIYFGKLRYAMEAMMPRYPKHLIIQYTKEQYEFALASEYNVWQYLVDMNWVYTNDMKVKLRFFEEAPTTVGIEESPGRMGQFMGWQMVRSYMENNPEVTVKELLEEESETLILKAYKPEE